MKALIMKKCYIDDFLDGKRTFDARKYKSNYRGRLALVESKSKMIYGYIDMVDCKRISYREYLDWHGYNYDDIKMLASYLHVKAPQVECYAYVMTNPITLDEPIKIYKTINQHMWFNYEEIDLVKPVKEKEINENDEIEEKESYNLFNMDEY